MARAKADGKSKTGIKAADKVRRRTEGNERNLAWSKLTAAQKLASLDSRLGAGIGARRQRAKLNKA
jgi:hypothetical protein